MNSVTPVTLFILLQVLHKSHLVRIQVCLTFPMDDSLQFIIESPQTAQGHKKRPRLVTSCDNCRLKKIKCLQPSPEAKCEACRTAKIQCRFRDRERYFAERSRAIAGPTSYDGSERSDSSLDAFSLPLRASGASRPDEDTRPRYPSYPSDTRSHHSPTSSFSSSRHNSAPYSYVPPNAAPLYQSRSQSPPPPPQHSTRPLSLFDADQQHPHPTLMQNFISVLFDQMASEFTFFSYSEVMNNFMERRITSILSNSIAAFAAQYSTVPELTVRGLHNVANAYADHAKQLLIHLMGQPCLDTLHALILLSWYEINNNRMSAFRSYYQMLMNMAVDLGLNSNSSAISVTAEDLKKKATWNAVLRLHNFYSDRHLSHGST